MKVQTVKFGDKITYIVVGDDFLPIKEINDYLKYLEDVDYSINTIRTYANSLSLFWRFMKIKDMPDWKITNLELIVEYVHFLRNPFYGTGLMTTYEATRSENTINLYLASLGSFYDFYCNNGVLINNPLYGKGNYRRTNYKSFLHHITLSKPHRNKTIKLKVPKKLPKLLKESEVILIIDSCNNLRDKFMFTLLYETGMRIGQALGLRHSDIKSMDNEVHIIPRNNNENFSRAKSHDSNVVHVSKDLMDSYTEYIVHELDELDSDYVFVNLWGGVKGKPLSYDTVSKIVKRLNKKTNIQFNLHMFRHTHATQLVKSGWDMSYVKKRLGHKQIQTTVNVYTHLSDEDMKKEIQKFHRLKNGD